MECKNYLATFANMYAYPQAVIFALIDKMLKNRQYRHQRVLALAVLC